MKAIFPVATLVLLTASSAVTAADHKRSATRGENIGLASGFIAGALLGGPPGALIGAAIGTHYGGTIERAHKVPALEDELDTAEDELSAAMARAADLRVAVGDAEQELAAMNREVARLVTERTLLAGLNVEVLYMTGEAEPGSDAEQRLEALADVLLGMPGLSVQLDGYADQRGSERFNALLSEARARGIEQRLIAAGI
ncbi:MAG: OmpA family protein, partial [Pseudomonadota bacterium]